jgi:hypothetical protein
VGVVKKAWTDICSNNDPKCNWHLDVKRGVGLCRKSMMVISSMPLDIHRIQSGVDSVACTVLPSIASDMVPILYDSCGVLLLLDSLDLMSLT